MTHLRRLIALLVLPLAVATSLSEPAHAGTYTVHGCRLHQEPSLRRTAGSAAPSVRGSRSATPARVGEA